MTQQFALRQRLAFGLLTAVAVGFVVALNLTPVFNSDFWIQLKVGDIIRETGSIPDTFEFTYTEGGDEPYVATNWLACLTFSQLYRIGGYDGMIVAKAALTVCIFGLIALLSRQVSRDPVLAIALGCFAVAGINFRSLMRPELLGFVLALIVLNLLHSYVRSGKPFWLLCLIPPSVVWANTHPSFMVSLAFPACLGLGELLDRLWSWKVGEGRPDWVSFRKRFGWLTLAGIGMLAAALINPYGIHLFEHLLQIPDSDFMRENIWEWHSALDPEFRDKRFFLLFASTVVLVVVSGLIGRRKLRAAPILLVVVFLPLAVNTMRHIPWFELVASYFLAHALGQSVWSRRWTLPLALALAVALAGGTVRVIDKGNTMGRRPSFRDGAPLKSAALDFIRSSELSGNVLHSYSYGDQLAYYFYPKIRVAMDTRIYGEKYYRQYRSVSGGSPAIQTDAETLRDYLVRYDVRAVVTKPFNLRVWSLVGNADVFESLGFKIAYYDKQTVILIVE